MQMPTTTGQPDLQVSEQSWRAQQAKIVLLDTSKGADNYPVLVKLLPK